MTREEAKIFLLQLHTDKQLNKSEHEALRIAVKALEQEPCREADDYENEISNLYNHLDIVEYDKERLREEMTTLEEKLKGLSAEPCEDAISRQAALKELKESAEHHANDSREEVLLRRDRDIIKALPPVAPKPKTGHWIYEDVLYSRCSECGELAIIANWAKVLSDFCPCCGAKMVEPQESEVEK